jgi:hypothetical protein
MSQDSWQGKGYELVTEHKISMTNPNACNSDQNFIRTRWIELNWLNSKLTPSRPRNGSERNVITS